MTESKAVYRPEAADVIESVVIGGDLKQLSAEQRVTYYQRVCQSLGLNPLTKPFSYIVLNGKLTLYANRDAADQLRKRDGVSITITDRQHEDGVYVVTAKAMLPDGRTDESTGAVYVDKLNGEAKANAFMKAETKAKRRVTLSICGLGWLDETETADIPTETVQAVTVTEAGEVVEEAESKQAEIPALMPRNSTKGNWWPTLVKDMAQHGYSGHPHVINALTKLQWDPAAMGPENEADIRAALIAHHAEPEPADA